MSAFEEDRELYGDPFKEIHRDSGGGTDVWSVVCRHDGQTLHTLRLWRSATMATLESLVDHHSAPGLSAGRVVLWNQRTGQVVL